MQHIFVHIIQLPAIKRVKFHQNSGFSCRNIHIYIHSNWHSQGVGWQASISLRFKQEWNLSNIIIFLSAEFVFFYEQQYLYSRLLALDVTVLCLTPSKNPPPPPPHPKHKQTTFVLHMIHALWNRTFQWIRIMDVDWQNVSAVVYGHLSGDFALHSEWNSKMEWLLTILMQHHSGSDSVALCIRSLSPNPLGFQSWPVPLRRHLGVKTSPMNDRTGRILTGEMKNLILTLGLISYKCNNKDRHILDVVCPVDHLGSYPGETKCIAITSKILIQFMVHFIAHN